MSRLAWTIDRRWLAVRWAAVLAVVLGLAFAPFASSWLHEACAEPQARSCHAPAPSQPADPDHEPDDCPLCATLASLDGLGLWRFGPSLAIPDSPESGLAPIDVARAAPRERNGTLGARGPPLA